jgi:hypothetical protein
MSVIVVQIILGRIDLGQKGGTERTGKDGLATNLYWYQDQA